METDSQFIDKQHVPPGKNLSRTSVAEGGGR
jgi:hypothetical protein